MRSTRYLAIMLLALTMSGCYGMTRQQQSTLSGGAIGAGGGALLGGISGGSPGCGSGIGWRRGCPHRIYPG